MTERQDDIKKYPPDKNIFDEISSEDRLASIYEMVAKNVDTVSYNHGENEYKSNITIVGKTSSIERLRADNQLRIIESMKNGDLNTIIKENFSNYQNQLADVLGTDKAQPKMQDDFANQVREVNAFVGGNNTPDFDDTAFDAGGYILDEMTVDEVPMLLEMVNEKVAKGLTISPSEIDQLNTSIRQAYHHMNHEHTMDELTVLVIQDRANMVKTLRENMNIGQDDKDIPAYAEIEIGTDKTYDELMDEYADKKANFDEKVLYDKETLFDTVYALQTYNFKGASNSNKRNPVLITEETRLLLGDEYKQFCDDKFNQKLDNLKEKHTNKSLLGIDVTRSNEKPIQQEFTQEKEFVSEPVVTPQKTKGVGRSIPSEFEDLVEQDLAKGDADYLPRD